MEHLILQPGNELVWLVVTWSRKESKLNFFSSIARHFERRQFTRHVERLMGERDNRPVNYRNGT